MQRKNEGSKGKERKGEKELPGQKGGRSKSGGDGRELFAIERVGGSGRGDSSDGFHRLELCIPFK
jgi:hypothetical protein